MKMTSRHLRFCPLGFIPHTIVFTIIIIIKSSSLMPLFSSSAIFILCIINVILVYILCIKKYFSLWETGGICIWWIIREVVCFQSLCSVLIYKSGRFQRFLKLVFISYICRATIRDCVFQSLFSDLSYIRWIGEVVCFHLSAQLGPLSRSSASYAFPFSQRLHPLPHICCHPNNGCPDPWLYFHHLVHPHMLLHLNLHMHRLASLPHHCGI